MPSAHPKNIPVQEAHLAFKSIPLQQSLMVYLVIFWRRSMWYVEKRPTKVDWMNT